MEEPLAAPRGLLLSLYINYHQPSQYLSIPLKRIIIRFTPSLTFLPAPSSFFYLASPNKYAL
ncbi:MAG: hypothetical protein B6U69_03640 [Thermofilum sp. ex4484_15]|nr:MAG: hypothetical protein B6U69_03640 [Thermofilum sp. ex4484_15]